MFRLPRRLEGGAVIIVGLVAVAAHASALIGGFVWLDHAHLQDGLALAPPSEWLGLFTRGFAGTGFYRPLMALSLSIDQALGGTSVWYHLVSLLWHAGASVMTGLAAQALGQARRPALLAGALFAIHPAGSLVAGAIAFRSEAMIAVALLGLVVAHRRGSPGLAALAIVGGALTKETAFVLAPLFIAALELDARRTGPGASSVAAPATRGRLLAAEVAALALALGLRLAFAPAWRATLPALSPGDAIGTRLASLAKSAALLLVPVDRTICDASPVTGVGGASAAGALVALALVVLAWRRRGPALLLALALLPALNLVPIMRWWSPHYLYVPLAFATMLAAEGLTLLLARARPRTRQLVIAAVGIAMFAGFGLSLHDSARFCDDVSLWRPEVVANDTCREGHFHLGQVALEAGRNAEAAAHLQRALAEPAGVLAYVDRGATLQNLGVAQLQLGQLDDARTNFRAALTAIPDTSAEASRRRRLVHNLATLELRTGDAGAAAALLEVEAARGDAQPESLFVRARALHQLGREDEAGALLRRLSTRLPSSSSPALERAGEPK